MFQLWQAVPCRAAQYFLFAPEIHGQNVSRHLTQVFCNINVMLLEMHMQQYYVCQKDKGSNKGQIITPLEGYTPESLSMIEQSFASSALF